jgi:DNA-binding YbaB/EbfC family protein
MSRFGGLPGGFGGMDIQKLMKQAQQAQEDVEKLGEELESARFEASAGGGMVTVTVNGHGHLIGLKINPVVADPDDVEMLEDLIITAAKEAITKAKSDQENRMESIKGKLGNFNLPPGMERLLGG